MTTRIAAVARIAATARGLVAVLLVAACSQAPAAPRRSPAIASPAASASGDAPPIALALSPADAGTDAALATALPVRRPGAYANLDPDDDFVVAPPEALPECAEDLARAGVTFKAASLPVVTQKRSKISCGAPQVVVYLRGPGNIAYNAAPLLTCGMALALASFERILQTEAATILGSPVARIDQIGTYSCREVAAYRGLVSEHSYANAIDVLRFVLKNGKSIEVLRDFDVGDAPLTKPAAAFLRVVSRRANDEDVFSHVLTPFFNAAHKNHFHLDLARYRNDGTRKID